MHITLNVENGSKHSVNPGQDIATVTFQSGDVIYVGDGNTYIGTLTCDGEQFSGNIVEPGDTEIYFYFVGGFGPDPAELTAGETASFNVNIATQSIKLPVLSIGSAPYKGSGSYTCELKNQCALVKFVLNREIPTDVTIKIENMHCDASINFAEPGINVEPSTNEVTLYAESTTVRWAVLLPQTENNPSVTIPGYTATISSSFPVITENMYYNDPGVSIFVGPTF